MTRGPVARWSRKVGVGVVTVAMALTGMAALASPAQAVDPAPPAAVPDPQTVSSDALPTWQINGVVWSQAIVGDVVYVTGSFTRARPPGVAAGGAGEVVANNIFAYRLSTGERVSSFSTNPGLNAQGLVIRASADGSRLWVGGDFTTVNGTARGHVAALNPADGSLVAGGGFVPPNVGGQVRGFGITPTTLYVGGNFTSANGVARTRLAAFSVSNGAMTSWAPAAAGGYVWAMTMSPDKSRVIPSGSFTTLSGQPAYGMGSLNASDGSVNPWPAQEKIRAAGANGAITSVKSDGSQIYGTSYAFGAGAAYEGTFAVDPMSGQINWVNDCLGDTYDIAPAGDVLYNASHQHDCTVIGGWPDTNPRVRWQKAAAQYSHATDIATKDDAYGWGSTYGLIGLPYAKGLHWYPNFAFGSYTSSRQAGWAVDASSDGQWLVYGGEFPRVNNVAQQGLVRFRTKAGAPKKSGPSYSTVPATPTPATTAVSLTSGTARVSWGSAWDQDDETLKYEVLRDNNTWVHETTGKSNFWTLPKMGFIDTGLAPGSTHRYQVRITDPDGNILWSPVSNTVTIGAGAPSAYESQVLADGAEHFWRLGEPTGAAVLDHVAFDDATLNGTYTRGQTGAISGDSDGSTSFDGSTGYAVNSAPITGPNVFSVEAWFRTTSTSGGKIIGFGNQATGLSNNYDRHAYMDPQGRVYFGVYNNGMYTVNTSQSFNDGQWHHVVGSLDPTGVTLYVDGKRVGRNGGTTTAQPYDGYWRIGGDSPWNGNAFFQGDIDDVAIYPTGLSLAQVQDHFSDSGRTVSGPTRPADAYGQAVWDSGPDLYWRLGEATGTTAKDSGPNESDGTYRGGYTLGAAGAVTGTSDTAASFNGSNGFVSSNQEFNNPHNYTIESWFKTTTNNGGKIIGFGCSQTDTSGCYDRHVYMSNDGKVTFGVWTGFTNTITTANALNDGQWHHVVATQSDVVGMALYVDGVLVGTNGQTDAQGYAGYWRVGGDNHWGCCSPFLDATIDEAAVYSTVLSASTVKAHFQAGGGQLANQLPTASFSHTESFLDLSVNGSGSSDPDGTIASYSWNWGDGSPAGSGATATHTYATAGDHEVTLTVTDNRGGTSTTTQTVTVTAPPPNQAPTSAFTVTKDFLAVSVNGSTSSDADGTIASYAWNWGDGSAAGSGVDATHTYAAAGDYTITLTVTDDDGATNSSTKDVSVVANQAPTAAFTHTENLLNVSVDGSTSTDADGSIASYAWNWGDGSPAGSGATDTHSYAAGGTYTVTLTVTDDKGLTGTKTGTVTVAGPPNQAPTAAFTSSKSFLTLSVNGSTSTDADGTIASYSWNWGDGTANGSGATASHTYAAAGTYTVTLTVVDDDGADDTETASVTVAANQAPTASFTSSVAGLAVSVNGSGSSDPDGTIASYSWNWGDGTANGSGATASHTYAAAGTYSVSLTVTDNSGATNTKVDPVTVAAPLLYARDDFGRTLASGWGTADVGGAWTLGGPAARWSVAGGQGRVSLNVGDGYTAFLPSVSSTTTEVAATVTTDKVPTGGGQYVSLLGRRVSATVDYRAKVRMAANGQVAVWLTRNQSGAETILTSATLAGVTYAAGDQLKVRLQVNGTTPTALRVKVWKSTATEPTAWSLTASDSTAAFQSAGSVGMYAYLSSSSTNGPVVYGLDQLWVGPPRP
ncbi:PKD domain-containing protein [Pedococcus aerophilus]|uniref:PKD domain-containing protein n=1 Tax=Pedococcus aerophilus TaxID=436356 RepID=A0ABP6H560_9MICO